MKVTNYMIHKWSKAALLIIFGIIFFLYMDPINQEMRSLFAEMSQGNDMPGLFDLSYAVYFIIALWCFVDAALNILTSFREQKTSLDDLALKIDTIEKKLQGARPSPTIGQTTFPQQPMVIEQENIGVTEIADVAPSPPTDIPPPP